MSDLVGGSIVWNLDVNKQKFSAGISSAKTEVGKFTDDAEKKFQSMSTSVTGSLNKAEQASKIFATGLLTVGTSIGAAVGLGIKTAAEFETLTTALQTVTGSSEQAAEAMKTIKQVAKDSPFFEVGTLAQFTQLMAASGQSIDEAVASGIKFGDVAAAFGKSNAEMSRMGNTLSQVIGKGKADIVDFKELVNAGWVSVRKDTAASMGVTMAQFEAMVTAGEVGYDQITKAAEKFTGAAENQSKSFSALMARLKETISTTFAELVIDTGIFDIAKNAVNQLIAVLDSIDTKQIAEVLKTLVDYLPVIAGTITGALIPAFYAWGIAMIPVITGLLASALALAPWIIAGALIGLAIKLLIDNWASLTLAWETGTAIVSNSISVMKDWVLVKWQEIQTAFWNAVNFIKNALTVLAQVLTIIINPWGAVVSYMVKNWDTIKLKFQEGVNFIRDIFGQIVSFLAGKVSEFASWGSRIAGSFVDAFKERLYTIVDGIRDVFNKAKALIQGNSPPKEGPFRNIDVWGFNVGSAWVDGMKSALSGLNSSLQSSLDVNKFNNLNINNIPTSDTGSTGVAGTTTNTTNSNPITVNIGQVNDVNDLDLLNREIGFRLGVTPA